MQKTIIAVLTFILILAGCDQSSEQENEEELIRSVKVLEVKNNSKKNTREISGALSPVKSSTLSFRVSGQVTDLYVKKGQKIARSSVIAKLRSTEYDSNLNSAKAKVTSTEASFTKQEQNYNRQQKLYSKKLISKADYEQAKSLYENAKSDLAIANENYKSAKQNVKYTSLNSPFDAIVSELYIDRYAEVKKGQDIVKIGSSDYFNAEILVPETIINDIKINDEALVTIPALKTEHLGTISEVGSQSEYGNSYPVTIKLIEPASKLFDGMTAVVQLSYSNSDESVILIPSSAVDFRFHDQANQEATIYLYVANQDNPTTGTIKQQKIKVVDLRKNMLEVSSGLKEGDKVVIAGVSYLSDGQAAKEWLE